MNEAPPPSRAIQLVVLAIASAACAAVVALAYVAVRPAPMTFSRFGGVAGVVWLVMLLVGVGLPWMLAPRH